VKRVVVVDGMGGGIGVQLCARIKEAAGVGYELLALGTNAVAVERMVKAGAVRGACGENAIRETVRAADIITGPIGIIIANSMMGEITARMTGAILRSRAERVLLPLQNEHFVLAGIDPIPLAEMIKKAVEHIKARLEAV
jgi:hypothetical protein